MVKVFAFALIVAVLVGAAVLLCVPPIVYAYACCGARRVPVVPWRR